MDEHVAPIRIPEATGASPPLITMDRASVGYEPGKPILTGLSFRFDPEDRIALLGKNGNGKSTLAKLLAGKLEADGRRIRARPQAGGGLFRPASAGRTRPHDHADRNPVAPAAQADRWNRCAASLGGFGFSADKQLTKVGQLSGGERARLMLALATLDKPNLLILDEPTNHLDIDARGELLNALNDFDGAVILVSHDRRLIEATAERLLLVADGKVAPFEGDLDDYRRFLLSGDNAPTRRRRTGSQAKPRKSPGAARRKSAKRCKPLKERIEAAESQVAALQAELAKLDKSLADPLLFTKDPAKGSAVSKKRAEAARKLAALESLWLAAQEEYESAMAAIELMQPAEQGCGRTEILIVVIYCRKCYPC